MYVRQHDLLRELAIYNAKVEPIEQRRRVFIDICGNDIPKWWREQKKQPLKARLVSITTDENFSMEWPDMQLPEAEVLVLHFKTQSYALPMFVEKMNKLKLLVVSDCGIFVLHPLSNFKLLLSLPNLKRIILRGIRFPNIFNDPIQLKSLRKLSITYCSFPLAKMSAIFPNLEEISIFYCIWIGANIDVYDLIHLKKMSFVSSKGDLVSPSIAKLVNLQVLRLRGIKKLPNSIRNLKRLMFLDISCCCFDELPERIGEVISLTKLDLRGCRLEKLPRSISELNQLEEVICDDEYTQDLWKPFLPTMKKLRVLCIEKLDLIHQPMEARMLAMQLWKLVQINGVRSMEAEQHRLSVAPFGQRWRTGYLKVARLAAYTGLQDREEASSNSGDDM